MLHWLPLQRQRRLPCSVALVVCARLHIFPMDFHLFSLVVLMPTCALHTMQGSTFPPPGSSFFMHLPSLCALIYIVIRILGRSSLSSVLHFPFKTQCERSFFRLAAAAAPAAAAAAAAEAAKGAKMSPRGSQEAPRSPHQASFLQPHSGMAVDLIFGSSLMCPRGFQEAPRGSQEAPRCPQEAPRSSQLASFFHPHSGVAVNLPPGERLNNLVRP